MRGLKFFGAAGAITIAACLASGAGRAEEVAAAAAARSNVCFNEGLFAKGAVVDYDSKITSDSGTQTGRAVLNVKAKQQFEGKSAIPVETETFNSKGKSEGVVKGYFNVEPGFLLILGTEGEGLRTTFDPAGREPNDLKKGGSYKQKYTITTTFEDQQPQKTKRQAVWKFAGFEELKLPVGKFKLCKVTAKLTDTFLSFTSVTNLTLYLAAEGPYRGFALRTNTSSTSPTGQPLNATTDVTKFRKFEPK